MSEESIVVNAASSVNQASDRHKIQAGLTALSCLVGSLIIWGALVRLTGSGLSIPDWPFINGSLLPPLSASAWQAAQVDYQVEAARLGDPAYPADVPHARFQAMFWIEYLHRTLAAVAGVGFLVLAFFIMRGGALRKELETSLIWMALLLVAQGLFGGLVVKAALPGLLIALHLLLAYAFWALLIWAALKLGRSTAVAGGSRSAGLQPLVWGWLGLALLVIQSFLGGMVAGAGHFKLVPTWPLMFGRIIPPSPELGAPAILTQFLHRWVAFLFLAAYLVLRLKTSPTPLAPSGKLVFRLLDSLIIVQIILGIANVVMIAPLPISLLHSVCGAGLFAGMVMILHTLRYGVVDVVPA